MDKKRIGVITWGFILVTALIVALMLSGNLRRSTRVTLPDTSGDSAEDGQLPVAGDALQTVVEIRPETVQTAIATLHRPESYRRSVTVEYLWDGGSSTLESVVSVREGWTRIDRSLPDGQVRHVLTDGETTYIWYNESAACFTGAAGRSPRIWSRPSPPMRMF